MEETKQLLRTLDTDVRGVSVALRALRLVVRRYGRALLVVVLVGGFFGWRFIDVSTCQTNRNHALNGPGMERVDRLYDALAVGFSETKLTPAQRAETLQALTAARAQYPLIGTDDALAKETDAQLLTLLNVIRGLGVNAQYREQSKQHPVCSLWSF